MQTKLKNPLLIRFEIQKEKLTKPQLVLTNELAN